MAATTTTSSTSTNATTAAANNGLPSPWAQVVKGSGGAGGGSSGDSPENAESTSSPNIPANDGNVPKKTAWNTAISPPLAQPPPPHQQPYPPPPGDHQPGVMGAASWPALSDSARLPLKSSVSSLDSPKLSSETSAPLSQGPVTSHLQQPKQGSANTGQNSSVNSAPPTRQKSFKRGGGGNRQGGFARGPPPPLPVPDMANTSLSKVDSTRELRPSGGFASHSNQSNEHPNHRSSNRRGNFGQHGRGDVRNNFHGGRRDQDHGNHDWSSSNSQGRGAHGHHHRPHGRGFMGPPVQVAPPFAAQLPVRPFANTLLYPDPGCVVYYVPSLPPDSFRNGPYITGPPPPPYLFQQESLRVSVIKQIDYYFSDENLVKDRFLRSKMDDQGWVPITLIASFPRVQSLSESIPFILDCLSTSTMVEVQGDKIRRRDEWMKWLSHQQSPSNPASGSQSPVGSYDNLTNAIEQVSLEEKQDQDHTSGERRGDNE